MAAPPWYSRIDLFYLACLILGGLIFLNDFVSAIELDRWDEPFYIFASSGWTFNAAWAPWYSIFLKFSRWFSPEALDILALNTKLLTIGIPALTFLIQRQLGVHRDLSFLTSALFLVAHINAPVFPKVNHFGLLIWLSLGLLGLLFRRSEHAPLLVFTGLSASLWIRPENLISLTVFGLFLLLYREKDRRIFFRPIFIELPLLAIFASYRLFGNPFGQSRAWLSFRDHIYNYGAFGSGLSVDEFIRSSFGPSQSIFEALLSNPLLVSKYVAYNCSLLFKEFLLATHRHFNLIVPDSSERSLFMLADLLLLVACSFALIAAKSHWPKFSRNREEPLVLPTAWLWALLFALGIRTLIVSALFEPYARYYLEFFIIGVILLTTCLHHRYISKLRLRSLSLIPISLILIMPKFAAHHPQPPLYVLSNLRPPATHFHDLVKDMRSIGLPQQIRCRSANYLWVYWGSNFHCHGDFGNQQGASPAALSKFLSENPLDIVYLDDKMIQAGKSDPSLNLAGVFAENYAAFGFELLATYPFDGTKIFIHSRLRQQLSAAVKAQKKTRL